MPFDAGMTSAVVKELQGGFVGSKIEKVYQPEKDEIIIAAKNGKETYKLLLSAKSGSSRIGLTELERKNPQTPFTFCMLLRKHISGGVIGAVRQLGFERAVEVEINSYDEMGFVSKKYLIAEITGRYSNVIFCKDDKKVISAIRLSHGLSDEKRPLLCGFKYEKLPIPEGKADPMSETKAGFLKRFTDFMNNMGGEYPCEKYFLSSYSGISPLISREICYRTSKNHAVLMSEVSADNLFLNFESIYAPVRNGNFVPYIIYDKEKNPIEYSFCEILQYGSMCVAEKQESFSKMLDRFYGERERAERIKAKSQDILKLLTSASSRIAKKTELQKNDLIQCRSKEKYKKYGDLIQSNIYMLKKGMTKVDVIDYTDENMPHVQINLEVNLTPSQNAQKYYKKYNKLKSAEENLGREIKNSENEQKYIDTVFDSLTKAQNENDLLEIREELVNCGYGKKLESLSGRNKNFKNNKNKVSKRVFAPLKFKTSGNVKVLCGKNNLQNDYITLTKASKDDYWFHVKGMPGSHVIMMCGKSEPDAQDFTECAMIAAYYSSGRNTPGVAVDYTKVRNIKKPSGAKPGFVTYETNYTAYVTADEKTVSALADTET